MLRVAGRAMRQSDTGSLRGVPSGSSGGSPAAAASAACRQSRTISVRDELAGLLVPGAISRQVVELDRIAEDEGAKAPVSRRPAERVQGRAERPVRPPASRSSGHRAGSAPGSRAAASSLRCGRKQRRRPSPPRAPPKGVAIAFATANGDHAHPGERLTENGDLEQLRLCEEVGDAGDERPDQRMVDAGEVIGGENAAAVARDPLDPVGGRRARAEASPARPCAARSARAVSGPRARASADRAASGAPSRSRWREGGRPSSSSRSRCSSCAILSLGLVELLAGHEPDLAKDAGEPGRPRGRRRSSRLATVPGTRRREPLPRRVRSRWTAWATLPAGSAMRTRAAPLPAALPLRFGGHTLDCVHRRQVRRRFRSRRFLGLFEDHFGSATVTVHLHVLAACELRLALLQDRQQRSGDEDRRVRAGDDADDQRANAKSFSVAPPKMSRATIGSSVMNVVASERRIVSQSETFAIVANDERRISGMFSRIRSKMMIVS